MKRALALVFVVVVVGKAGQAQQPEPQCAPATSPTSPDFITSDACQKAVDLFKYMFPQLGALITSGNATPSASGTMGGLGHARFELRANMLVGSVPNMQDAAPQPAAYRSDSYGTSTHTFELVAAKADIGIFHGFDLGPTRVGGLDALLEATHIFDVTADQLYLDRVTVRSTETNIEWGAGARLGLLEQSRIVPGVVLTYAYRRLPTTSIAGRVSTSSDIWSTLKVDNVRETTNAWRLVANKTLTRASLAAGVGRERYRARATINTTVNFGFTGGTRSLPTLMDESLDRTSYFVQGSTDGTPLRLTGELGMVAGGRVETYNHYAKPANAARLYGSIGVRFDFPRR